MNKLLTIIVMFSCAFLSSQNKIEFLTKNRFDLNNENLVFPQDNFKIIGFGALHGSAKTYLAEINLIKTIQKQTVIDFYVPEASFSQAFYFQKYLENGDEKLLKELVLSFQTIVSQEGSIETFEHWKNLKKLNDENPLKKIKVIGFDIINDYEFPIKHILYLTENITNWKERDKLAIYLTDNDTNFGLSNQELEKDLKLFIESYQKYQSIYDSSIKDTFSFKYVIDNISSNFNKNREREKIIFSNYKILKDIYNLENKKLFIKYGSFHIQKAREEDYPSFFTRLIENNLYKREEIITVMGYLTKSEVLWNKIYDKNGNYKTYTIEKGYGIGDYWKEYYKGIRNLKKTAVSDITLFRLNTYESPYKSGTDLVEVKMFLKDYNTSVLRGKNTLQFIDYAILIRNSEAQKPIEELAQ